jgi:hypothetical protein
VLPAVHKRLITSEINTILREINDNQSWVEKERHSSSMNRNAGSVTAMDTSSGSSSRGKESDFLKRNHSMNSRSPPPEPLAGSFGAGSDASLVRRDSSVEEFLDFPVKGMSYHHSYGIEYSDICLIEELVTDTAIATNRGMERMNEWLALLKDQDIMNVGDLRGLHEEDWVSLYVPIPPGLHI